MTDPLFSALEAAFGLPEEEREAYLHEHFADAPELLEEALTTLRYSGSELELPLLARPLFVGFMAGKYPLFEVIGQGAMGVVYRSRQPDTERDVAVKLMLTPRGMDPSKSLRQQREILSSARLAHENIVRVLDAGYDEPIGAHYSVMELVPEGRSLRGLDCTPEEAAKLIIAVCRALEHAHRAGVVHRDVKPGNILLTPDGVPKLTDFGLALDERFAADRLTLTDEFAGTPHYMSPEQVRRRKAPIDHRTDIYSTGAVLYELLTHTPPHEGQSSVEIFTKILEEIPRRLDATVPRDLATICFKALRKDPDDRYATIAEMADDLERFLANEPILARPEPRLRRIWRTLKRNPVKSTVAICTIVFAIGLYLFYTQPYEGSPLHRQNEKRYQELIERNLDLIEQRERDE